jgi:hydroxyacylglutathione hydrolase
MRVVVIPCLSDNYAFLLVADDGRAAVVDPAEAARVEKRIRAERADLRAIWLTHHHYDHIGGIEALSRTFDSVEVVGSLRDLRDERIPGQTRGVDEGQALRFGNLNVDIVEVPGHTLGGVAYLVDGSLFTGDTLFLAGCGRVFEGSMEMMQGSLEKLRRLDPDTRIYCGHEYTANNLEFALTVEPDNRETRAQMKRIEQLGKRGEPSVPGTLDQEREVNPFLRWDADPVIDWARRAGAANDSPAEVFSAVRKAKDLF